MGRLDESRAAVGWKGLLSLIPVRKCRPREAAIAFTLGVVIVASAHVGSSNAYFEGMAGPYPVRVIVRTPGVIPGLAQVSVRITGESEPNLVTVRPLRWDAGLEGAPPPDTARAVSGESGLYSAELWLMTTGSYSVHVSVAGDAGEGTVFVPVNAVAETRKEMSRAMAVGLIGAALFLFVGAVTVFGAAVRESVLAPGEQPDRKRRLQGAVATGLGGGVLAAILWGGWAWWGAVDTAYRAGIYRPLATTSVVEAGRAGPVLTLRIDDPEWMGREWTPLMPDHGKLMHMFLVGDGPLGAFAHVHPESADSTSFAVPFPPLPPGTYRIYADIVQESGFSQTLVDTVTVGAEIVALGQEIIGGGVETVTLGAGVETASLEPTRDPDDSWAVVPAAGRASDERFLLPSGRTLVWEAGRQPRLDAETTLAFRVTEPDGTPSALEPYMGMLSHAAVTRDDGSVFIHMHPAGSINLAAQDRFQRVEEGAGVDVPGRAMPGMSELTPADAVSFPFVFPAPGAYRIFVQVKIDGVVETAVFDVGVPEV